MHSINNDAVSLALGSSSDDESDAEAAGSQGGSPTGTSGAAGNRSSGKSNCFNTGTAYAPSKLNSMRKKLLTRLKKKLHPAAAVRAEEVRCASHPATCCPACCLKA
jgi:hypothetical protein